MKFWLKAKSFFQEGCIIPRKLIWGSISYWWLTATLFWFVALLFMFPTYCTTDPINWEFVVGSFLGSISIAITLEAFRYSITVSAAGSVNRGLGRLYEVRTSSLQTRRQVATMLHYINAYKLSQDEINKITEHERREIDFAFEDYKVSLVVGDREATEGLQVLGGLQTTSFFVEHEIQQQEFKETLGRLEKMHCELVNVLKGC
mgnify:CR=1 FL=1